MTIISWSGPKTVQGVSPENGVRKYTKYTRHKRVWNVVNIAAQLCHLYGKVVLWDEMGLKLQTVEKKWFKVSKTISKAEVINSLHSESTVLMFYGRTNKEDLNSREGEALWGSPSLAKILQGSPFKTSLCGWNQNSSSIFSLSPK